MAFRIHRNTRCASLASPFTGRYVSYFATIKNGYALVFIFIGENEKSVDEMAKAMESFDTALPVRRGVTTVSGSAPQRRPN